MLSISDFRFPTGWRLITLILYSPFGLLLAFLRSFIGFQVLFAAAFVPHVSFIKRSVTEFGIIYILSRTYVC